MDITTSTPVVTGASRGLGRALVDALLERGVSKVYALARNPSTIRDNPRIVPIAFDLSDPQTIPAPPRAAPTPPC
jgi:NAD(P)-dependent dehydrogenase (short-subunit alcohol dehydrogenase family)